MQKGGWSEDPTDRRLGGRSEQGAFQKSPFEQGIPLTVFAADDLQKEHERLEAPGVAFRTRPTQMGPAFIAVFEDTCGNLNQLDQV
jgi:hypothetical protein